MIMEKSTISRNFALTLGLLVSAVILAGCQPAKKEPADPQPPARQANAPQPKPKPPPLPPTRPQPPKQQPASQATPGVWDPWKEPGPKAAAEQPPDVTPQPRPDAAPEAAPDAPIRPPSDRAVSVEPNNVPEPPLVVEADKAPDLGPPLVDNFKDLQQLDKVRPVWLDKVNNRVVMVGRVWQTDALLELFACLKDTKEHEAIVTVDVKAITVHAGLLAVGANVGHPVKFDPQYVPAAGTQIEVTVVWKDKDGRRQTAPAQDWIFDLETKKAMTHPWGFAGSGFWEDEQTGQRHYQAESGDFICVSNFSTAMLDLPIQSSDQNNALMFKAFTERIPPRGTPVTLLLAPKLKKGK